MKLAVVIPTYQRTRKLDRCLKSILTGSFKNLKVFVYADAEDYETYDHVKKYYNPRKVKCLVNKERKYVIGSWNDFASNYLFDYDAMAWIVDDVELDKDCFKNAMELLEEEFPDTDGMVGLTQQYPGHPEVMWRENGQCIIGQKFISRFPNRQICCPEYTHFYQDEEVLEYAKSINKFILCHNATLVHHHPAFYPSERDDTHKIVRGDLMAKDTKIYRLRKEKGLIWGKSFELINKEKS